MIPKNKSEADWLQGSHIWGIGKKNEYFMYKLPFTAFPHARNHVHGKHSDEFHSQVHQGQNQDLNFV